MFAEGELFRIAVTLGGALALVALLFALARRMLGAGRRRVAAALEQLDVSRLERPSREVVGNALRLRFSFRGQRALLDFPAPRPIVEHALAPHSFGGLVDQNLPVTRLRFWLSPPPVTEAKSDLGSSAIEGPWSPTAMAQLEALRARHLEGISIATTPEGMFLVKAGWLPGADLQGFVDGACALVAMHLDGTLF